MTVIQRPAMLCFAADMADYIIDSDSTITFAIQLNGSLILSERYSPDGANQIRIRKLGRLCRLALWGRFSTGAQDNAMGSFTFLINDVADSTSTVIFSNTHSKFKAGACWLSSVRNKVTRSSSIEYLSCYIPSGSQVTLKKTTAAGEIESVFYTNSSTDVIMTLDVSLAVVGSCLRYSLTIGTDVFTLHVDDTQYIDVFTFRYRNNFEMPETLSIVGGLKLKGNDESAIADMYGIARKFEVKCTDEYTANSGVIYMQSDYKLWHDLFMSQEVEILSDGAWYKIVVSKQNYERTFRRSILKAVEFSFKMADLDDNGIIEI